MGAGLRRVLAVGALLVLARAAIAAGAPEGISLPRLEAGVRAAESVRAVKRLQHAYAHYLGEGMWADAAALFTDGAEARFGGDHVTGRDALRGYPMREAGRRSDGLAAGQLHAHLVMQPIVTLGADGRSAKATWHEMQLLGRYGKSAGWTGGVYENQYVLEDGTWKISRIDYTPQYAGDYDDYGHKAPPKWNIPYHFEARHVGVTIPPEALVALEREAGATGAALATRVAALADETQVRNLQHAFGYYLDRKMWDDVADLFADGGSLEFAQRGTYVGRERIRGALEAFYGPSPLRHGELFDHILLGTIVTLSPDGREAFARSAELAQVGLLGEYAQWQLGTFENRFVREDGRWKLAAVRRFPRMVTDYDLGWARDARPAPGPSKAFPPDRPSAKGFASYPARQRVEPHFANPVTGRGGNARGRAAGDAATDTGNGIPDLVRLDLQLRREIAVDAVENLNSSYGYYIDESDWDGMADTYASTGSKEITGVGVYVGPDRIRRILKLRGPLGGRSATFFTIHQLTQPVITVADDGLGARARLRLFQDGGSADGSSGSWIGGIYENTAVFEEGEWKFGVQDLHHSFNASYRNGWARVGPASGTPLKGRAPSPRDQRGGGITQGLGGAASPRSFASQMPPDRPIRARQYTFPQIDEPAFHYVNPVSGRAPPALMP